VDARASECCGAFPAGKSALGLGTGNGSSAIGILKIRREMVIW